MKLKIPFYRQRYEYTCGPASLKMAAEYFGIKFSQKEIIKLVKANSKTGTDQRDMIRFARIAGLYHYSKINSTITDIKKFIKRGLPIIVNFIKPPESWGHFAIVTGFDDKNLILNDPEEGKDFKIPIKEFPEKWHSFMKVNDKPAYPKWLMVLSLKRIV